MPTHPPAPSTADGHAPSVRFERVTKRYADGTTAVAELDLDVPAGQTTVLVGSSGCGKTTLLRMVNRMVTPTSGRVLIDEVDVAGEDPVRLRRRIGYVLQASGLLPHRRVLDNVATVPRLNGEPKQAARAKAREMLELVGLEPSYAERYPAQLSGGQQQRVGVARALAADPALLLMDEPFGAVDPIVRATLQDDVAELQRRLHKTVIFVTHDIGEAFTLGDHVVVLSTGGVIEQQGSPRQILAEPANEFVADFIGLGSGASALRVESLGGSEVVVDGNGRPLGRLDEPRDRDAP